MFGCECQTNVDGFSERSSDDYTLRGINKVMKAVHVDLAPLLQHQLVFGTVITP